MIFSTPAYTNHKEILRQSRATTNLERSIPLKGTIDDIVVQFYCSFSPFFVMFHKHIILYFL